MSDSKLHIHLQNYPVNSVEANKLEFKYSDQITNNYPDDIDLGYKEPKGNLQSDFLERKPTDNSKKGKDSI